jgi:hypothetical protein
MTNGGGTILYRFTVTADAAENVALKKISFKAAINGSADANISSPAIREVGQGSDLSASATAQGAQGLGQGTTNCGFAAATTTQCVTVVFDSEQVVAAGTSKTYELRATTSGFTTAGDAVSTTLLGDTLLAVGELDTLQAGVTTGPKTGIDAVASGNDGTYNFLWSDNNAIPHNDTVDSGNGNNAVASGSNDWTNGIYVKVLPGDAQTLTRS